LDSTSWRAIPDGDVVDGHRVGVGVGLMSARGQAANRDGARVPSSWAWQHRVSTCRETFDAVERCFDAITAS